MTNILQQAFNQALQRIASEKSAKEAVKNRELPKLTHVNCPIQDCPLCLEEHLHLGNYLEKKTGNHRIDHLGHYRLFLEKKGIDCETEWGWATQEYFDMGNINDYIDEMIVEAKE